MKTLLLLALLLLPTPALAWGPEGHQVVAHIAAMNLTPRAREAVSSLLEGDAEAMMAIDSTWADEIRDQRPQTSPWHFVNLEVDGDLAYVPGRDCRADNCVVAQIARDDAVLKSDAGRAQKAEVLKFLIHFVGDIHQPLHAGERHDSGGNTVRLTWHGNRTNLHHIWDDEVVSALGRDPFMVAQAINGGLTPAQKAAWGNGGPQDWAQDSAHIARDAIYAPLAKSDRYDLRAAYVLDNSKIARVQLAKAGLALAKALNAAFANRSTG